jgi:hypothetical protein
MKQSYVLCLVFISILSQSCASFTGFQDGKTLGNNNWDLSGSINRGTTPSFDENTSPEDITDFASFELGSRYGISDKVDLSLKINTNFNVAIGTKYQIKGDLLSKNALAIGLEVGSFTVLAPLLNIQLPLYYSHHFNDKWTWNFSPRYVIQFNAGKRDEFRGIHYVGGNTGFMFGRKHKIAVDFGLYRANISEDNSIKTSFINTFGLGGRFMFLDDKDDSVIEKKSRRPKRQREK